MMNYKRYQRVPVIDYPEREWPNKQIEKAPVWCSVDLRDGNQALIDPMQVDEKVEFFQYLLKLGFREIEIGFPSASQIEYDFLRQLVDRRMIPEDCKVQVLTQCREELIDKTFESIEGIKNTIVHIYNSTSTLQRDVVFHKDKKEIIDIALAGTRMVKERAKNFDGNIFLEYSPESYTGTEDDFALEICNAVIDEWGPTPENPIIINLPSTVEMTTPNVYADRIEWMDKRLNKRDCVILSIHPHNDRGCGVASAELAMLAGADRVEGTLFGNGERTGNVDVITLAMNMFTHGVDPCLDFTDMPRIQEVYERLTGMEIYPREPYCGKLVFAAFSGSHQDAIAKGMKYRENDPDQMWTVPYLPLNPEDIGRTYDGDVIRINSQSGKGGIGFILETKYGYDIPKKMKEDVGYAVKGVSDRSHKELKPEEVYDVFMSQYVNIEDPIRFIECHFQQIDGIKCELTIFAANKGDNGATKVYHGQGNGRLDAVRNAIMKHFDVAFDIADYEEHALSVGSNSKACAYVGIKVDGIEKIVWGAGIKDDIIDASVYALISAVNKALK
jgi:2-isopropylmalate synthase